MDRFAILFGVLLCGLGLVGYYSPDTLGKSDARSPTALIPAAVGVVLLICGLIAVAAPKARKHAMHVAAAIALLGAIGGIMPLRKGLDLEKASVVSAILMISLCTIFVLLCVRSFVRARIARSEHLPPERQI
jgi:Ca2+/Na+ antiporter